MSNVLVTTTFERTLIAQQAFISDVDGTQTVILTYHISRVDDLSVQYEGADYVTMVTEGILPALGTTYATWMAVAAPPLEFAACRSIEFTSNKIGTVTATVLFNGLQAIKPSTLTGATPYSHLPAYAEYQASTRSIEGWRRGWAVAPPANADSTGDIGGSALTSTKGGMPIEVPQVRIRLRFVRDATVAGMSTQAATVTSYIGKKNSHAFLGFPVGSVICEGMNMVHMNQEYYETVLDFLYDAYNHHIQVPTLNPDGTIKEDAAGDADEVKWKRVDRTATDFNAIFGGDPDLQAIVEKGYWN